MPILIEEFLTDHRELVCIEEDKTVLTALGLMIPKKYSQLPIIDDEGKLKGLISDESILRYHLHHKRTFNLSVLVTECADQPITIKRDDDFNQALDQIKNIKSLVIVDDNRKPIGILTDWDMTSILRKLGGDFFLVEAIELTIRGFIEQALPTSAERDAAAVLAKKPKSFDKLSFKDQVDLILAEENWSKFEIVFHPKDQFEELMADVNQIRNTLMHFRSRPDPVEHDKLELASKWLASRPPIVSAKITKIEQIIAPEPTTEEILQEAKGKYGRLIGWLMVSEERQLTLRFNDIENLINEKLPASALRHRAWWANDKTHSHASMWLDAGWQVVHVDFKAQTVTLQRPNATLYQQFFADLLEQLKQVRPGLTKAIKTQPYNWFWFGAGRAGVYLGWTFHREVLSVEVDIESTDKPTNKRYFAKLLRDKDAIEKEIGELLLWEELEDNKLSRVRIDRKCKITDPPDELEQAKVWALETILKFVDAFQPRIKNL